MAPPKYVSLSALQAARKLAVVVGGSLGLCVLALTQATVFGDNVHELVEDVGLALILTCIIGRVWCSLYIGGRKVRELIDNGPYSTVRNPLYFFSFIGAAGVGAQSGSITIALGCVLIAWVIFAAVVAREEEALVQVHGEAYVAYRNQTPRFIPRPGLWWDRERLMIQPPRVMATFVGGLFFLLAIPLAESLEYFQEIRVLPILADLP